MLYVSTVIYPAGNLGARRYTLIGSSPNLDGLISLVLDGYRSGRLRLDAPLYASLAPIPAGVRLTPWPGAVPLCSLLVAKS